MAQLTSVYFLHACAYSNTRIGRVYLLCDQSITVENTQVVFVGEFVKLHYVSFMFMPKLVN